MHFKVSFMWQKYEKRGSFDLHIVFCHELEFAGDPSSCLDFFNSRCFIRCSMAGLFKGRNT